MELLEKKSAPHHTEEKRSKKSDEPTAVENGEDALNSSEYEDCDESVSDADSEKQSKEGSTNPKKEKSAILQHEALSKEKAENEPGSAGL